jgi:hypothetical protein
MPEYLHSKIYTQINLRSNLTLTTPFNFNNCSPIYLIKNKKRQLEKLPKEI